MNTEKSIFFHNNNLKMKEEWEKNFNEDDDIEENLDEILKEEVDEERFCFEKEGFDDDDLDIDKEKDAENENNNEYDGEYDDEYDDEMFNDEEFDDDFEELEIDDEY